MNRKKFEEKVINLIPSKTVKTKIKELNHHFEDIELIRIIDMYSKYRDVRLKLFNQSLNVFTDKKLLKFIKSLIEYEHKIYDDFITQTEGYIYELKIKDTPTSATEKYLCPTFLSALNTIKLFYRCYKEYAKDNELSLYEITKIKVMERKKVKDIDENEELGTITLGYKYKINRVYVYHNKIREPKYKKQLLEEYVVSYPTIFKKYDLVSFHGDGIHYIYTEDSVHRFNFDETQICYGINSFDNDGESVSCVLYLNNHYVKNRCVDTKDEYGYYPYYMQHTHLDFGLLEIVDLNEVSSEIADDYLYVVNELKNIEKNNDDL